MLQHVYVWSRSVGYRAKYISWRGKVVLTSSVFNPLIDSRKVHRYFYGLKVRYLDGSLLNDLNL